MVPLRLFRSRAFLSANVANFLLAFAMFAGFLMLIQFFAHARGEGALTVGLHTLFWTAMPMLVAPYAGRLGKRIAPAAVASGGLLLVAGGMLLLGLVESPDTTVLELAPAMVAIGVGIGLVIPNIAAAALGAVPPTDIGKASGILSTSRQVGSVAGVSVGLAIYEAAAGSGAAGVSSGVSVVLFVAAAAAATAALAAGAQRTVADLAGRHGAERAAEIERRAKGESGDLRLYTTLDERTIGGVLERFTADTGIRAALYRAKSEEVLKRVARESRAHVAGADVVEANGAGLVVLDRASALTPIAPDDPGTLVSGADRGGWVVSRAQWFVVSRNTDAVPAAERPRAVADLADPRWKGRLSLEPGDWDWYVTLRAHWMKARGSTGAQADRRFEAIARNARLVDGHSFQSQLVASGEFDVAAADYAYVVEASRSARAPIAWKPPAAPIVSRDNGVAIPRTARRPAKALRFADWNLLGPAQAVFARLGVAPARRDLVADPGVPVLQIDDAAALARQREASRAYRRITRLAGKDRPRTAEAAAPCRRR